MFDILAHGGTSHENSVESSSHYLKEPVIAIIVTSLAVVLIAIIIVSQLSRGTNAKVEVKTSEKEPGKSTNE